MCVRVLKCLIPATVVPQEAVVRAVAWLCVSKIAISTQVKSSSVKGLCKSHTLTDLKVDTGDWT